MSGEKVRIGVVGLGAFVEIAHMPTYFDSAYSELVEVAAICDLNAARLAKIGDAYRIKARFGDHRAMLAGADLDAVVVATPDHAHTQVVLDAIAAGKDVLVEKPLAMRTTEARAIVEASERAGVLVLVDFHKREDPCHAEARARIENGDYGALQFGWVWMQDVIRVAAGGFFHSDLAARSSPNWFLGTHFYDCIRFLTGAEPVEVRAAGYRQELAARGIDTLDAVKADFVFSRGEAVSFFTSWNLPDAAPFLTRQGLYLQFSRGDVEIDSARRGFVETCAHAHRFVNPMFLRRTPRGPAGYGIESIGEALRVFHACKSGDRDEALARVHAQTATAHDGLWATLMAEAVDLSLARGRREGSVQVGRVVKLAEVPGANA